MIKVRLARCAIVAVVLWAISLSAPADNFSQHPGFATHLAAHPPDSRAVSRHDKGLLQRYRPRLWVGPDQDGPIGFYRDYIAHGTLYDAGGDPISSDVDQALLNRHKQHPGMTFVHAPADRGAQAIVPARVDHARLPCTPEFTFLTYNFVFHDSGLPAGLAVWKEWPLRLITDLDDWHQLDHYTAASVVLGPAQKPLALLVQQHNGQRSYVFGEDIPLPADGRVELSAALRSNELYPRGRGRHRTVQFMSPAGLRYLVTGEDKPLFASEDITEDGREIPYTLEFLLHDDAFYLFQGALGARRPLPGRDGPPGALYHTLPMFMNRALQLVAFHWAEGDTRQMRLLLDFTQASRAQGRAATDSAAFNQLCAQFMAAITPR